MLADEFIEKLYAACKSENIGKFQIKYSFSAEEFLNVFDGQISSRENSQEQLYLLEISKNGKVGRFGISSPDEGDIPFIISQAMENASLIDDADENFFYDGKGEYPRVLPYVPLVDKLNSLNKEDFLLAAEKRAYQNPLIDKVIRCFYSRNYGRSSICNSLGLKQSKDFDSASAGIYLSAKKGDVVKTAGEYVFFDKAEDFSVENFVDKAVEKAVKRLETINKTIENQYVVLSPRAFSSLLPKIASLFSAKAVQDKKSRLCGKLGQKIAADNVTVIDNPLLEKGFGTAAYDSEGVPTIYKEVIKNGILQTYLYNLKTAHKDGVKSTGNASGTGIGVGNFYLKPGEASKQALLDKAGNSIWIESLNGLHAGFDIVSGDFSFGAEGFEISRGKIGAALEQFTIAGNIYQLLTDIVMAGDDLEFYGSKFGSPSVLVKGLKVSGE